MEKTTNILFIHLPSFIFLLSILSEKQKTGGGRESLKRRFLLNCHKYSFIKMWNNQIFYIFAFMDNQTAADDF